VVDLRQSPSENITALAEALGRAPSELTVAVQDRPRHATLVAQVLATGARVRSFSDGDVAAALLAARTGSGVDLLLGTGGAPEGVLAAAAVGSLGGLFQGRLAPTTDEQVAAAHRGGFDLDEVLQIEDLVGYDYAFVATGITDSELAPGIHSAPGGLVATTLVLGSGGAVRRIVTSEYPTPRSAQ
jgi:fructose-1,6-bisphosphatase II